MHRRAWLLPAALALTFLLATGASDARPERIKPGMSYYSDEYVVEGGVHDLGDEKNYEEVYQHYTYYEAVYDAAGRVVLFKEYERGEVIRSETYRYDEEGKLVEKTVTPPAP